MSRKRVRVIRETESGRNVRFRHGNKTMTRPQFVREIKKGNYPDYHVRRIGGVETPASNPDKSRKNNLD